MNQVSHKTALGEIRVIDAPFDRALAESTTAALENQSWQFGWASNSSDEFRFWHVDLDLEDALSPTCIAAKAAWMVLSGGLLKQHSLLKVYANAHAYGGEGSIHTDGRGLDGYFSSVYFCHRTWQPEWAGELLFFTEDKSEIEFAIIPKANRLIVFPGSIPHTIRPPSRSCASLRVSLVFKSTAASELDDQLTNRS